MKIKSLLAVSAGVILIAGNVFAEPAPAPTRYNAYDGFTPGARAIAMGGAFCALGDDAASAEYYNPAGMTELKDSVVAGTYEMMRQSDLTTQKIFANEPMNDGGIEQLCFVTQKAGFMWRPLSNSTNLIQNGQDFENDQVKINAYTVSAAHQANQHYSLGLNITYLTGLIAQSKLTGGVPNMNLTSGYGMSMDLGMILKAAPGIRLGVDLKNMLGFMWWEGYDKDLIPFNLLAGIDFQISQFMNFEVDTDRKYYRKAGELDMTRIGIEQWLGKVIALRGGVASSNFNDDNQTTYSAGLGYVTSGFELSLAGQQYKLDSIDVSRVVVSANLPL